MTYHPNSPIGKAQTERDSDQCPACGKAKKRGQAFCTDCFYDESISRETRANLYRKTEDDRYLEALEEAKEALK